VRLQASLVLGLTLGLTVRPAPGASPPTPNVIVIMTDDQRWDTIGNIHGHRDGLDQALPQVTMPYVTQLLVNQGVTFTNAFATTPLCAPSRASFLTGRRAGSHQVLGNDDEASFATFQTLESNLLPVWMQGTAGGSTAYRTGYFGKYTNNYRALSPFYVPPGWTKWYALEGQGKYVNPHIVHIPPGESVPQSVQLTGYSTDLLRDEAVKFIHESRAANEPFFMVFAPNAPHGTATDLTVCDDPDGAGPAPRCPIPGADYRDTFPESTHPDWNPLSFNEGCAENETSETCTADDDKSTWLRNVPVISGLYYDYAQQWRRRSLESLQSVDDAVKRLYDALSDSVPGVPTAPAVLANTVIIYTSDNGYAWGEHKWGDKRVPYEESIRVPLVVRPAGGVSARTETSLALNIDLAPTIVALAGKSPGDCVDGKSLVPFLGAAPPSPAPIWRDEFAIEHFGGGGVPLYAAMRLLNRKYVEYLDPPPNTVAPEFYNLTSDPSELTNTYADNTVAAAKIAARLRSASPGWPLTDPPSYLFSSTFECGSADLAKWSAHSPTNVTVAAAAALGGTAFGLKVDVVNSQPANVQSDEPTAEGKYHARFYFDPNDFYPGPGNPQASPPKPGEVYLFFAAENGPRRLIAVTLRKPGDNYRVLVRARLENENGSENENDIWSDAAFDVANEPHIVEFEWKKASSASSNDGYLKVWMDPPNATAPPNVELTNLDNPANGVDFARLGAISVEDGASGTLYFDQFMSRRDLHIGPQ
jgi:arylsulfatase A-like enzyme